NYSYNKGYKISHEEARGILRIREDHFVTLLLHAVVVPLLQENRIGSYGKHGGNRQKERKFSSGHAGKFLLHPPNDGGGTAAYTRHHGQTLPQTNGKGLLVSDFLFVMHRMGSKEFINEEKYNTAQNKHDRDRYWIAENRFNHIIKKIT